MEFIAIAFIGLLIAIALGLIVNKNRKERAKESLRLTQERERQETIRADLAAAKAAEEAKPKTEDHLAPKTDLRSANEAVAKAKAASHPAVGGGSTPSTPPNNTYYGKQPRVPRVTDNDPSNAAFLALIAAQQHDALTAAQLLNNGGVIDENGKPVEDQLSPEDEQKLEDAYNNLVADSKTEESKAAEQPAPTERNDFSYDSSDNASTYNSTTANGSDSSSSYSSGSSSSSYSSYDSGSSSSSSSDSGSSGGGGGE